MVALLSIESLAQRARLFWLQKYNCTVNNAIRQLQTHIILSVYLLLTIVLLLHFEFLQYQQPIL